MPHLTISLFGPVVVKLDSATVSGFTSKKAQALLTYLAVEAGRPHSREELAGLLWPDYPDAAARTSLRSVLANVRRVVGDRYATPPFLAVAGETMQFNRDSNHYLDVAVFDRLPPGGWGDTQAVDLLETAVAAVKGPFLAGFSLADSPPFEEWMLIKREFFGRQLAAARQQLACYWLAQGACARALAHAERWAALEPWQEEAHQLVMRILAQDGRRGDALRHFDSCCRILRAEVGLGPSEATIALAEEIRRGAPAPTSLPERVGPGRMTSKHLPLPLTPFVGRDVEVRQVAGLLSDPKQRLITIVGPGGMGKTHLAMVVAGDLSRQFADGAAVVALAPLQMADEIVTTIAEALGFQFYEVAPPEQQLLDYLRDKHLLLVMDNCEHLPAARGVLERMLAAAPRLKILATSRTRLHTPYEQLFPVAGLAFPRPGETADSTSYASYAAIALFVQSVQRLRPDFVPLVGAPDLDDIAHICALLAGMPLGILLASAWTEVLSLREIAHEIARDFQFLHSAGDGLPARHQSLVIVFRQSWQLLTAAEQLAFRRISVFRGGFTRAAAEAIAGAEPAQLLGLAQKYFLQATPAGHGAAAVRYEVHELLRQFAAHELSRQLEDECATRQRHCAHYLAVAERCGEELKGSRQLAALDTLESDAGNVRAAWQWACEERRHDLLAQAVTGLGLFYEWRGYYQEGEANCREALQRIAGEATSASCRPAVKLLYWQARFRRYLGDRRSGIQLAQRGLDLLKSLVVAHQDVRAERAALMLELGELSVDYAQGQQLFEHGLALAKSVGDPWRTAQASCLLGHRLANAPGSDKQGQELLEESLRLYQELGDRRRTLGVLKIIGFSAVLRGDHIRGELLLRESLAIAQEMPGDIETLECMHLLAHGLVICGKYTEACSIADEGMLRCQVLGHRPWLARAHGLTTNAELGIGRYDSAYQQGLLALQAAEDIGDPVLASFALWRLGDVKLAQGQCAEAGALLQRSIEIHRRLQIHGRMQDVLASEGYAAYALGQSHEVRRCLVEALEMALCGRLWFTAIRALPLAALYAISRGQTEAAVELYALASSMQHIAHSAWFADVAGRRVAEAARVLPVAAVCAAQARGRTCELWQTIEEVLESLLQDA